MYIIAVQWKKMHNQNSFFFLGAWTGNFQKLKEPDDTIQYGGDIRVTSQCYINVYLSMKINLCWRKWNICITYNQNLFSCSIHVLQFFSFSMWIVDKFVDELIQFYSRIVWPLSLCLPLRSQQYVLQESHMWRTEIRSRGTTRHSLRLGPVSQVVLFYCCTNSNLTLCQSMRICLSMLTCTLIFRISTRYKGTSEKSLSRLIPPPPAWNFPWKNTNKTLKCHCPLFAE